MSTAVAPLISLVLATVGRSSELQSLIDSLQRQTERRFELIVVDQNADDRLLAPLQALRAEGVDVQHLRQVERNLSLARNLGVQAARAAIVAFPDDDGWYEPGTVQQAAEALARQPDADGLIGCWVEAGAGPAEGLARLEDWRRFRGGPASSITLFLRTQALRRWGGFDDRLGVGQWYGAGEETDLVLRALALGARLLHRPAVRVHHAVQAQRSQRWQALLQRERGTGALWVRHRLPVWVMGRGLIGPLVASLVRGAQGPTGLQAAAIVIGRLQGLVGWACRRGQR